MTSNSHLLNRGQVVKVGTKTMENEKGYNGWTNYETWNVALWLDNDGLFDSGYFAGCEELHDLADQIEEYVRENMPELGASMYADLLGAAISEVNWREIAEAHEELLKTEAE